MGTLPRKPNGYIIVIQIWWVMRGERMSEQRTMTKGALIEEIAEIRDLNLKRAEVIVNKIFDTMTDALVEGNRVEIRGFGSFEVRNYEPYTGRNPKTGEKMKIKASKTVGFKASSTLKGSL